MLIESKDVPKAPPRPPKPAPLPDPNPPAASSSFAGLQSFKRVQS